MSGQKQHRRKSIRLKNYDYSNPNWYYITICSFNRKSIFGTIKKSKMILSNYGKIVAENWKAIPNHFKNVSLDYYVVMPNHLHGIIIKVGTRHALSLRITENLVILFHVHCRPSLVHLNQR